MSANNQYFDYTSNPSLFEQGQKNSRGQYALKVKSKQPISHDTYKFCLQFPNPEWIAGLWPGGHFLFMAEINGEMCQKPYTPISPVNHKGEAEFVIKIYRNHPDFPQGGKFSQHLENNV